MASPFRGHGQAWSADLFEQSRKQTRTCNSSTLTHIEFTAWDNGYGILSAAG